MGLKFDLIAGATALLAVGGGVGAVYWSGRQAGVAAEKPRTAAAAALAAEAGAGARAAVDAARIIDAGAARTQTIIVREGDHRAEIVAAKGAEARLDPDLVSAARRGLCEYTAYRDDGVCELLRADAAELSLAGAAGSAAAP